MKVVTLDENSKQNLLDELLKRSPNHYGEFSERVNAIIEDVKKNKDAALFSYTERFDGAKLDASTIRVTKEEIEEAYHEVDPKLLEVIKKALVNIRSYHEKQRRYSWFDSKPDGTLLGQKIGPIASCGVYVPGGKAVYPVLRSDERGPGQGGRCGAYCHDHTARKGRQGISEYPGGSL